MNLTLEDIQAVERAIKPIIQRDIVTLKKTFGKKTKGDLVKQGRAYTNLNKFMRLYLKTQIQRNVIRVSPLGSKGSCQLYDIGSGTLFKQVPLLLVKPQAYGDIIKLNREFYLTHTSSTKDVRGFKVTDYISPYIDQIKFKQEI